MTSKTRVRTARYGSFFAATAAIALVVAGCSSSDDDNGGGGSTGGSTAAGDIDCSQFSSYGDLKGKEVTIYAGVVAPEDQPYVDSFKPFEKCTGVKVNYTADKNFEQQVLVQAEAGNAPDLAIVPQPGLLKQLVATGKAVKAPDSVSQNADKWFGADWKKYGTVDGTFYAAPSGASVKSLVWYSPTQFASAGYEVPTTLDDLKALSDKMVADGNKPWCAGINSGEATGWPITDWVEDFVLRLDGPDVYDQWVAGDVKFTDPKIVSAFDGVGAYLKNSDYVNAGIGDVKSIATTTFQDAGLNIDPVNGDGSCWLHRQASFYAANFDKNANIGPDGDVYAFYLPGKTADDHPVLGAGEFVLAFSDRPEVQALQTFWSTDTWANLKAKASSEDTKGGWISANKGLDEANLVGPIDKLSVQILKDPKTVFRFDGSDQMPAAVGSGSFWKQATNWITGQSTQDTVTKIQAAWPKS
ncbi:ABC transporter substrate-binding protein [Luteimicrobium subarcticum]|uniref:Carbohydrate ABC transporter substrate-binding protein (CUT1 family) n=1 Tax=Luteimicrobium subarcticum TaxID=620910 RepID=A0A2M8W733_9MICO|nr:ABC transporter substrate-binding protein [Luteimicrobium subarcticum]PJI86741.1 carbohydrate ABC transporter substrate-binding protein (CUT1 family) [Luteimicrobium subarcticum]